MDIYIIMNASSGSLRIQFVIWMSLQAHLYKYNYFSEVHQLRFDAAIGKAKSPSI